MTKILGILLLLTIVKAQVRFPGEEPDPTAEAGEDTADKDLFDALEITDRHGIPTVDSSFCVTPDERSGTCQSFSSCPAFASLRNSLNNPAIVNFLRKRICRKLRFTYHLCCPNSNTNTRPTSSPFQPSPSNRISQQGCGEAPLAQRIVGGQVAEPGEWPWMALLGQRIGNTFATLCGGALITRRHVLTAGHCFIGTAIPSVVKLGAYDLRDSSSTLVAPQDINIRNRRDGGYNDRTKENDISIVIMDREATLNDYVQIACLPYPFRNRNFEGDDLVITGWGWLSFTSQRSSNLPMKAVVPVKNTNSCIRDYSKLSRNEQPVIDNRSLCAGNGTTDACRGDSGGPIHYLDLKNEKYYVVGIVSFGVGCARPEFPGVYTRVTSFLDWIEENAV